MPALEAKAEVKAAVAQTSNAPNNGVRRPATLLPTMVIVPEVIKAVKAIRDVPVLAAGGIMTGRQMAAAMAMGFILLWIAVIAEANRLEVSIVTAAADAARELEGDLHAVTTGSPVNQEADIEERQGREEPSFGT